AVFSSGGFAARPAWQPDPRYGRGRRAATRLYPRGVVDGPLPGARFLSETGLGGRCPDRMRAARPYAVLYDQEALRLRRRSPGGAGFRSHVVMPQNHSARLQRPQGFSAIAFDIRFRV